MPGRYSHGSGLSRSHPHLVSGKQRGRPPSRFTEGEPREVPELLQVTSDSGRRAGHRPGVPSFSFHFLVVLDVHHSLITSCPRPPHEAVTEVSPVSPCQGWAIENLKKLNSGMGSVSRGGGKAEQFPERSQLPRET